MPRLSSNRRLIVRLHLWAGLIAGAYFVLIGVTGAALVFRIELQRASFPSLFAAPADTSRADEVTWLRTIHDAYPGHQLSGVDSPTAARPTVLAYLTRGREFITVLADPVSGRPLGVLPERTWIRTLQDLHFDLLAGRTGRMVNGIGALLLLGMCVSGVILWWPFAPRWLRAPLALGRGSKRFTWDLHVTAGVLSALALATLAVTGLSFTFGPQFRAVVGAFSPLTVSRAPASSEPATGAEPLRWEQPIATARSRMPGLHIARIVLPAAGRAAFLVQFAERTPTPVGADLRSVYVDQYSGRILSIDDGSARTAGDHVMRWASRLHFGNFAGRPLQVAWFVMGLMPAILFVTGVIVWWRRAIS